MYKPLILLFTLLLTIPYLNAQTEKGTNLLGGNASFQVVNDATLFVFSPAYGHFIKDKLALGLQANIITSDGHSNWGLGPFARMYFGQQSTGKFFGQAAVSVSGSSGSDVSLGAGISGGYAIFLNKSIAIDIAATYQRINEIGIFTMGAGFQVHFKKESKK